jgi:hypothetical protein
VRERDLRDLDTGPQPAILGERPRPWGLRAARESCSSAGSWNGGPVSFTHVCVALATNHGIAALLPECRKPIPLMTLRSTLKKDLNGDRDNHRFSLADRLFKVIRLRVTRQLESGQFIIAGPWAYSDSIS